MVDRANSRRRTKVERVLETYDLGEWGAKLEAEWLGEEGERTSLRDLARSLNLAVLRAALRDADREPSGRELENTYELLTDDDAPAAERIRRRRELEREGVDVEAVTSDFVTHQAVHTYLTNVRDASLERDEDDRSRRERKKETIQRLASRTQVVTDSTLEELSRAGLLADRGYDVLVTVQAVCERCGRTYPADELIESGGCACEPAARDVGRE